MNITWKRIIAVIMTGVMLFGVVSSSSFCVHAESTLEKLQKAKEEKSKTEDAKENAEKTHQSLKITQNSLLGQLSSLNDDLTKVSENLEEIETQITEKNADIERTQAELEEAIETEEEQYANMKLRIRSIYLSGNQNYIDLLLCADSFADFMNKSDYVERMSAYDKKMLEDYQATRAYVAQVKADLEKELAELDELKVQTTEEQQKVTQLVNHTANSVASYANQIADAESTIDALESMITAQEADIVALQKQYEKELELSRLAAQSAWRDISEVTFEEGDRYLLANLIYCEAGGEPYAGQVAVGAVVINRVLSSRYPNTVVGVIYQNKQFSPVASGRLALALANNKATASCYKAADEAMSGMTNVGQCVYFRTPIEGLTGISIGGHIFY